MKVYDTGRLDKLFSEMARITIHQRQIMDAMQMAADKGEQMPKPPKDLGDCPYPQTGMETMDMLLKKYIDSYLSWKYHLLDLELKKDALLYSRNPDFDETDILCLVIIQEACYKMMTGDCYQIFDIIELYASENTCNKLGEELKKYPPLGAIDPPEIVGENEDCILYKTAEWGTLPIDISLGE